MQGAHWWHSLRILLKLYKLFFHVNTRRKHEMVTELKKYMLQAASIIIDRLQFKKDTGHS